MAEQNPSLQIDTDWKKQAQEEKRRLAEEQKQSPPATAAPTTSPTTPAAGAARDPRSGRQLPQASFATLVQSLVTQALFYLGDLSVRGGEPVVNLDMAKHHIDSLAILEEKTANNLTPDEKQLLDSALYESRMRYVSTASQYIS
ncbi:MAG TPA: DUF1844 domain-containing protein [Tepidisphaeraceae bacterium]|nr:DUF1844 domain-containing protein [Tepidisphaeraceae bacterium]